MSKSVKQRPAASSVAVPPPNSARPTACDPKIKKAEPSSKQSRVSAEQAIE
jgi:hypothetical protein